VKAVLEPPALIRPAEDLAILAAEINAEHEAGECASRKGLEHFRAAGERLIRAKAQCGHGKFKAWIEKHIHCSYRTAACYMQIAREWEKCAAAAHLRDALRLLTDDAPDDDEPSDVAPSDSVTLDQWNEAADDGLAKTEMTADLKNQCCVISGNAPNDDEAQLPHVALNSGNNEWYTPPEYLAAARTALGGIDLDPASSAIAQETVQAERFFTAEDDGLAQEWAGTVWLNPPYAVDLIGRFVGKLCEHVQAGDVPAAILLVNNATDTKWFHEAVPLCAAVCFTAGRVRFLDPEGNPGAPLQGQALLYFGREPDRFVESFSALGYSLKNPAWGERPA
jgi:ParB family chromosome partitioning protein